MEYQSTDEVTRKEACEKVKKIADALIRIRKKYYLCFNKISDVDQKRYNQLKAQMQSVASENGLEKFNAQLISDIDIQFSDKIPNGTDENGNPNNTSIDDLHKQFERAVALQAELTAMAKNAIGTDNKLASAYFKKATKIQNHIKELRSILEKSYSKIRLECEKGSILSDKFVEQTKEYINNLLAGCYENLTSKDPLEGKNAKDAMEECTRTSTLKRTTPELLRM